MHIITAIDYFKDSETVTSNFLAGSVGANPVIIRFHKNPNMDCPVGRSIHAAMNDRLRAIQDSAVGKTPLRNGSRRGVL